MPNIIKDNSVIEDQWTLIAKEAEVAPDQKAILPLSLWLKTSNRDQYGLWLDSDESPEQIEADVSKLDIIAINFPSFADGRGFSYGRELREKGFKGELRAIGNFMRDQLFFLKRCGFNAFQLTNNDQQKALDSLNDFTHCYQASIDQEHPLFKRR